MTQMIEGEGSHVLYFVNAHTLNCAVDDPGYRDVLNTADVVFGDGTGIRWAARMQGVRLMANLNGTDLLPLFFDAASGRGLRYYLLGATPDTVARAAAHCESRHPGWELSGYHNGYVFDAPIDPILDDIAEARPDMLLVGMGNPIQERFIHDHRHRMDVPLVVGVGGLFDHWAGNIVRAPAWVRRAGFEWAQLLVQQPKKAGRYLVGNPVYLYRALRERVRP
jgi:N-acetylglucosaminyldiphosphoundecaprenol N-acetyl-beta-D-mannosaminyltransferase